MKLSVNLRQIPSLNYQLTTLSTTYFSMWFSEPKNCAFQIRTQLKIFTICQQSKFEIMNHIVPFIWYEQSFHNVKFHNLRKYWQKMKKIHHRNTNIKSTCVKERRKKNCISQSGSQYLFVLCTNLIRQYHRELVDLLPLVPVNMHLTKTFLPLKKCISDFFWNSFP